MALGWLGVASVALGSKTLSQDGGFRLIMRIAKAPAGSSQRDFAAGSRNCRTSRMRFFSSTAITAADPICRTIDRFMWKPPGSVASSSVTRKRPHLYTSREETIFIVHLPRNGRRKSVQRQRVHDIGRRQPAAPRRDDA